MECWSPLAPFSTSCACDKIHCHLHSPTRYLAAAKMTTRDRQGSTTPYSFVYIATFYTIQWRADRFKQESTCRNLAKRSAACEFPTSLSCGLVVKARQQGLLDANELSHSKRCSH